MDDQDRPPHDATGVEASDAGHEKDSAAAAGSESPEEGAAAEQAAEDAVED